MGQEEEMERVQDVVKQSLTRLFGLWDELGIDESGKRERNGTVVKHVTFLLDKMINEEIMAKKKILDSLEHHTKQAVKLSKELGVSFEEPDNSLVLVRYERAMRHEAERLSQLKEERMREVKLLRKGDEELCQRLGMDPFYIASNTVPTTTHITGLKDHIASLEEILRSRSTEFSEMKATILKLYQELEIEPLSQIERDIACEETDWFVLSTKNMSHVTSVLSDLVEKIKQNQKRVMECVDKIDILYDRLKLDTGAKFQFLANNRGHSTSVIAALEKEIERLEELKRANIEKFVINIRNELHQLWDLCFWSESQRNDFLPLHCTLFTEDLLNEHEAEVERMKQYYEDNKDLLIKVSQRHEVWSKFMELERKAKDPSRLMNCRGASLLTEEKERNKVNRMLPKLEQELARLISAWEEQNGKTFLVKGVNFAAYIENQREEHILQLEQEKIAREQAKKMTIVQESRYGAKPSTPARLKLSSTNVRTPSFKANKITPGSSRILSRINTGLATIRSPRAAAAKAKTNDSTSSTILKKKRRSSYGIKRGGKKVTQKEKLKRGVLADIDDSIIQTRSGGGLPLEGVENYAKFKNGNLLNSTEAETRFDGRSPHYLTPTKAAQNKLFKTPNSPYSRYSRSQSKMRTPSSSHKNLPLLI